MSDPVSPDLVTNTATAVDLVILTIREHRLQALLIRRALPPFRGRWALPGGFVLPGEHLSEAARRELAEETGIRQSAGHLEQLATYGAPTRDPRGRVISVAYLALVPEAPAPVAGSDASASKWVPIHDLPSLAFDHPQILGDGIERARAKLEYTTLATAFLPESFTLSELRAVYEAVWGAELDGPNFRRKVLASGDFAVPTMSERAAGQPGRPATLYRAGGAARLHPPILRPFPPPPPDQAQAVGKQVRPSAP